MDLYSCAEAGFRGADDTGAGAEPHQIAAIRRVGARRCRVSAFAAPVWRFVTELAGAAGYTWGAFRERPP
jgi:hypothetical protein